MLNKIRIEVDNFASISSADFELNKVTVIKGGDVESLSDLNRILFANLFSLSREGDYIGNNLFKECLKESLDNEDLYNRFVTGLRRYNVSYDYLSNKLNKFKEKLPKEENVDFTQVEEYLELFKDSKKYRLAVFDEMIKREFKTNKIDEYDDYEIKLTIDDEYESYVKCKNKKRELGITYGMNTVPGIVIYLDKPNIFDLAPDFDSYYHYEELYRLMGDAFIEGKNDIIEIEENNELYEKMYQKVDEGDMAGFMYYSNKLREKKYFSQIPNGNGNKHLRTIDSLLGGPGIPKKSVLIMNNIDEGMDERFFKLAALCCSVEVSVLNLFIVLINTQNQEFIDALKEYFDDLLVYNAVINENGKYDFKLEE